MRAHFSITLLLLVLLSACASAAEANPSATLFIVNSSTEPVCKVHLTSMDEDEIDALLVTMEHPLDPGDNVEMMVPVDSNLNIAVEDCQGNFVETVRGLQVPIEGLSYHLGVGSGN